MNKIYLIHPQGGNLTVYLNEIPFIATVRHDISMIIANEDVVPQLLEKTCDCGCGNGNVKKCLRYASKEEIELWSKD